MAQRVMLRLLAVAWVGIFLASTTLSATYATDTTTPPTPTPTASANDDQDIYNIGAEQENENAQQDGDGESEDEDPVAQLPPGHWVENAPCDTANSGGCVDYVTCSDGSQSIGYTYVLESTGDPFLTTERCPDDPPLTTTTTPPVNIPGAVMTAFENVELPESEVIIQPPDGRTLVNFKTILSTSAVRHQINVPLPKLGISVLLEVWPSGFTWHHGDGSEQTSTIAGALWSEGADIDSADFVTHVYTKMFDDAQVSVDTTWSAQFKGPGDATWRPVDGTVTKVGPPVPLDVLEATPQLVTDSTY